VSKLLNVYIVHVFQVVTATSMTVKVSRVLSWASWVHRWRWSPFRNDDRKRYMCKYNKRIFAVVYI